jgi:hypothetical protein
MLPAVWGDRCTEPEGGRTVTNSDLVPLGAIGRARRHERGRRKRATGSEPMGPEVSQGGDDDTPRER